MHFKLHIQLHHHFFFLVTIPTLRFILIQYKFIQCFLNVLHFITIPLLVILRADYHLKHFEDLYSCFTFTFTLDFSDCYIYQQIHIILVEIVGIMGHDNSHCLQTFVKAVFVSSVCEMQELLTIERIILLKLFKCQIR